jgi:multidrug efflux pump subunit AcrA (membrane-fusion protein)
VKIRPRLRHPHRLPLPRRPLEWALAVVAAGLIVIGATSIGSSSTSSAATKRTATVGKGVVQSTVSGNGTLEPGQKLELSFGASGEVTDIYVKAGQKVTKGEVLAEVDSSSARASLASAEAQQLEAEEAVESAEEAEEEGLETAYEGGAGSTVFVGLMSEEGTAAGEEESPTPTDEGEATGGEGAGTGKEEGSKSEKPTTGTEAPAKTDEPTTGEAAPVQDEAATPATEGAAAPAEGSTGAESSSDAATAGGSVSLPTAEANLREAELSVRSARQEVRETTLRAPISGTIAQVSGSVGETVTGGSSGGGGTSESSAPGAVGDESSGESSGSAFIVLAQLHRLKLEVSFSESDIGKVRKGQAATVSVDAMEGTELAGRVTKVSVLPSEGSSGVVEYPATILLTQSAKGLRAGMSASAEVVVEQADDAVTVSSEAISSVGGRKTVTVEEDGKEVTKQVKTGLEGDETTQVISGLKAGETVVLPEASVASATPGGESGALPGGGGFPGGGLSVEGAGFSLPSGGGFPGGAP